MRTVIILLIVALGIYSLFILSLYIAGKRTAARAIGGFIPDCIGLFKNLLMDPRLPKRYKIALALLIAYLAMPIDLVPDFIPIAGQLDDAILVALTLRYALKGAGKELAQKHWPGPQSSLDALLKLARI
jgi:uncharacterized membrane protein YkvA (DUF1232 family)